MSIPPAEQRNWSLMARHATARRRRPSRRIDDRRRHGRRRRCSAVRSHSCALGRPASSTRPPHRIGDSPTRRHHDDDGAVAAAADDDLHDDDVPAPAGPGFIPGQVTAVGDSVMLDYQDPLKTAIPGI